MPKVDATRNYYADLQVTPASSSEEVKKQYRKLAMQWHPDRNRGKEEEASKKFQIIQAAFEILTDPTLKRQYDEARNKSASRFPTSSGVRGNPWANAGADFPPPPKRTGANTAGAGPQPRPTSGASRYNNWGQTSGANSRKTSQNTDTGSAKAHYDAWKNMRPNANASTPRKPPPTPGRPPTSSTRDSKTSDAEGVPRTASQKQKAQASFGNTARRTGFTPRSPGPGDEPPVSNNNYFTTRTRANIFPDEPASTTSQSRRVPPVPDPLAQFRDNFVDGRHSSPYATPGGEKTSLFGDGLNRARSTRDSSRPSTSHDADTSFPFPRQRSSSTPRSSSNDGSSEDSTKVNTGAKVNSSADSASASHRPSDRYRPQSAESAQTSSGGKAQSAADKNRTDGTANQPNDNSTKYAISSRTASATQNRPRIHSPSGKSQRATTTHPMTTESRLRSTSSEVNQTVPRLLPFEQYLKNHVDRLIRRIGDPASYGISNDTGRGKEKRVEFASVPTYHLQDSTNDLNSFGYTNDSTYTSAKFDRASADNISTQFVDEQPEAFSFTAGGPPAEDIPLPSKRGSQSSSRLGRRSPMKINRRPVPAPPGPSPMRPETSASDEGATAKFSAAEWGEKIGSEHFVPKPSTSASTSPTRRTNSRRGSKPIKVTRGGSAGIIDDDDEIPTATAAWTDAPKPPPRTQSPMAMDIDEPSVEKDGEAGDEDVTEDGARKIPVEPTRPEWRAGNVDVKGKDQEQRPTLSTDTTNTTAAQSKSAPASAQPFVAQNGGSEDSEEFRASFADFKKVEPFTDPQPTGLNSFADLKTTLPFESRASGHVPLSKPQAAPDLDFPAVPVAPRLHPTIAVGLRPSNTQWRKYSQDFYNYMEKWETFTEIVLTHFATRQFEMKKRREQFGRAWLEGVHGEDGAALYQIELQQDHEIRKKWMRYCDEHQARVQEFITFRDRAK
ncbi:hypothetical protein PFICI_04658 [Pestalotiopsis fici W106-1]|uniref:J domain-containing protein n=1 Tax=Pestalotiopsis fici (strain W106-1 / CGMCC3.15140) TaxID=1229662 RepID=W3XBI6_PESFW|nr:uncharacterized protein PFICI_04658 [Pestalotiopsis fici W106-1]ETS82782.1 hypothetical protein PFICI_04658 [Pestalotiopsis fici W106-1]